MRDPREPSPPALQDHIAIIGMGCRLPGGAADPDAWLALLEQSADAVVEQPPGRWSTARYQDDAGGAGRLRPRRAGFLREDIFAFEPAFFGISPREAASLDPQQRLLLEVSWETLVDAGVQAERLAGSATGVYVGGFTLDSMLSRFSAANQDAIDSHTATSSSMTLLSNRLSYVYDLRGPSMTVDTACSSSLVALHLACEGLRRGDCTLALAGGVNVMLQPYYPIVMSRGQFLSSDGRCKTFEQDADGYGRGEGCGLVLLKRLDRALADGDRIHAVVRATGINQDGATNGIAMPNPDAQAALIAQTCDRAGLAPASIGYVEAHGTGTRAGDPAETGAIGRTYGQDRTVPLPIGSVKANVGHLEAAAGVAGLLKAVLSVRERKIFPHRPLRQPSPDIPFQALRLRVPQTVEDWPLPGPARAAINSFGYGGTNAHTIVEAAPDSPPRASAPWPGHGILPLAARSPEGLADAAAALLPLLDRAPLGDLAGMLAHRQSHDPTRAAVLAADAEEARAALRALADGASHPALITGQAAPGGLTWVFTGMGPQWWGMGQDLYARSARFQAAVEEADALFVALGGRSILAELLRPEAESRMARNDVAQPANLLLQLGLIAVLREEGPAPDAILGHSVGEVAAAYAAGCLSLEDAVRVSIHRSTLQQRAAGKGGMLALGTGAEDVAARLIGTPVVIAADNAPGLVTLAGPHDALAEWEAWAASVGIFSKRVRVEVPYHSPAMDPIEAELRAALADLTPRPPTLPLYSTMTGARVEGAVHDADYWWRNTRGAVLLRQATQAALADGQRLFLEVGPHPVLAMSLRAVGEAAGASIETLRCLLRGAPEPETLRATAATAWTLGKALPWERLAPQGRFVPLPRPRWRRIHTWAETPSARDLRLGRADAHPLGQERLEGARTALRTRLTGPALPWLADHVVEQSVILPGAAHAEAILALAAALEAPLVLEDLSLTTPLVLAPSTAVDLLVDADEGGLATVYSREVEEGTPGPWRPHATARLLPGARHRAPPPWSLAALHARTVGGELLDPAGFYDALAARGLHYGPAFQGVQRLWRLPDGLIAELALPEGIEASAYALHPALLDAAFQCLVAVADAPEGRALLPVGIGRLRVSQTGARHALVQARLRPQDAADGRTLADLWLLDAESGALIAEVQGLACALAPARSTAQLVAEHYAPCTPPAPVARAAVAGEGPLADALRAALGPDLDPHAPDVLLAFGPFSEDPVGERACAALLAALPALRPEGRRLLVTSGGALTAPGEAVSPAMAALSALARVVMTEAPERAPRLLDVDVADSAGLRAALAVQAEEELALRGGALLARRLVRAEPRDLPAARPAEVASLDGVPAALRAGTAGRLDSLGFHALRRRAPGPGEVEIRVECASLNFKDLMKAMGMLSDRALERVYLGRELGMEAAGHVVAVGEGVTGLHVGEPVFAYCGGALRTHLVVDARFVVPRPPGISAEVGACLFVFMTAWYALHHAGRLQPGETVLIHSAAGGVGLAAVQIARAIGAEVLVTAGTEARREALRALGLRHVFDSRTLDFADEVRAVTGGRGVDVALNALAGPALDKTLELLAPGGRFLELGKQDIASARPLRMSPFNRALSFIAIDLDRMARERPDWFAPVATEVMAAMQAGILQPLPTLSLPAARAEEAFRALGAGEVIGKVALDLSGGEVPIHPAPAVVPGPGQRWLVTGGLGGFGLRIGQWLAAQGVPSLVLASRSGQARGADAGRLAALRARGVQVEERALDVTDAAATRALLDALPDLSGVVHAAMELADAPLGALDREQLRRAMGAKARGAWCLHRALAGRPEVSLLLVGSISAWLGNGGQAAYAAANGALDGLAALRAAQGLPGASVAFGALGEAGVVARDAATRAHLASLGLTAMPPAQALARLAEALPSGCPRLCIAEIDWDRWATAAPGIGWSRLAGLRSGSAREDQQGWRSAPPAERLARILDAARAAAAAVLRAAPEDIAPERSLRDQGLDSILAVELSVALRGALGVELSAMELLASRGLDSLARTLLRRAGLEDEPIPAPAAVPLAVETEAERLLGRIDVTRPYLKLEDLTVAGDLLRATVRPDLLDAPGTLNPVPSAEVGRHLAILGSMACARLWPGEGRMAWPVASSRLVLEPGLPARPAARFSLEARSVHLDPQAGRARAEGVMRDAEGRVVGRLEVGYHAIPIADFRALFAAHARPTPLPDADPYAVAAPVPPGDWDGRTFTRTLAPFAPEDCAGHFDGLPAVPVSILGRHVMQAVLDGRQAAGLHSGGLSLREARLHTERFAWAGEALTLAAQPAESDPAGAWTCTIYTAQGQVAAFTLEVAAAAEPRTRRGRPAPAAAETPA